jgi:carboxyl-terminal processing protease
VATFDAAWTIVHETHFDTTFGGVDWNAVRDELRPRAEQARSMNELREVIRTMLGRLGQSHFELVPSGVADALDLDAPTDWSGDPGFSIREVDGMQIVTRVDAHGPAAGAVKPGWQLLAIDGVPVESIVSRVSTGFPPARAGLESWIQVLRRLAGPVGSQANLEFSRMEGAPSVEVAVTRRRTPGRTVLFGHLPPLRAHLEYEARPTPGGGRAGVIRFNSWMLPASVAFDRAMDDLRDTDGIVIDLRGNLGGLAPMIVGVSGHFFDTRETLGTVISRGQRLNLIANPRRVDTAGNRVTPFAGPVAVLVDERSYSASEFFAGGMQSTGRVRVFGTRSLGGALGAAFDRLPNGDLLEHAVADFMTADGTRLEGRGVIPDEPTPPRREALLRGEDPAVDAALRWIDTMRQDKE